MTAIRTSEFKSYVEYLKGGDDKIVTTMPSSVVTVNINGLRDMTEQYQSAKAALQAWTVSTGIKFVLTNSASANIVMDNEEDGSAYCSYEEVTNGGTVALRTRINVGTDWMDGFPKDMQWGAGTYGLQTFIHEVGHSLGLYHGGPYNFVGEYDKDAIFGIDTHQYSIMSYFDQSNYKGATWLNVSSPMIADIAAIREMYGKISVNTGSTLYGRGETVMGGITNLTRYPDSAYTIVDNGGLDTIDLRGGTVKSTLDLRGGHFSDINGNKGNLAIDFTTVIEKAVGSDVVDKIIGNAANNIINGLAGKDSLYGGDGKDKMFGGRDDDKLYGGDGNDVLRGEGGSDLFIFVADAGIDSIMDFQDRLDRIGFTDKSIGFGDLDISMRSGTTIIDFGEGVIKLAGIDESAISKTDFVFGFA